ncbi:virion protein [Pseudomonas phage KPP23]|nr:virion protein [Pseudomonas phage KPP23]
MGRVLTNNTSAAYAREQTPGILPGAPVWRQLEPNSYGDAGATITTVARNPISRGRQRRKGTVTDLDSQFNFDGDLTLSHLEDFIEGFAFARFAGGAVFAPTEVTDTSYKVQAGGALPAGALVFARGFVNPSNNGLKPVVAGSTATDINVAGLVEEANVAANAEVAVAGVRAGAGDLKIDAQGNLTSTALDFTTLNLNPGQAIWIGGEAAENRFNGAANRGFVRVRKVEANKLTIDKRNQAFSVDAGAGKSIDLYFGRFVRNVSQEHTDFLEQSYQFELAYPGLAVDGSESYEYLLGNYCNELTVDMPLTNKATMSFGFIGLDTPPPTTVRAPGADQAIIPNKTAAFNTTADYVRLRITEIDETGLTTDFKSMNLSLNNNVGPEKVLGRLGARYMNAGNFEVGLETQLIFTDARVVEAIRQNQTVTLDFAMRNEDGAFLVDIAAVTLGDGSKEYPVNESVLINITCEAFADPVLNTSLGITIFPYVPKN